MTWFVLGAGKSGSSVAMHLAKRGKDVLVADRNISALDRRELESHGISVSVAPQTAENFSLAGYEGFVPSPGISPTHELIRSAITLEVPLFSDIDLALEEFQGEVIAVTGTNGKSTSVAMLAHIINTVSNKRAIACGNIGYPILSALNQYPDANVWVIELSSYQIEYSQPIPAHAVLLTSFSPDHLARHKTEANYFAAKWRLVAANGHGTPLYCDNSFFAAATRFKAEWPQGEPNRLPAKENIERLINKYAPQLVTGHDQQNAWITSKLASDFLGVSQIDCAASLDSFKTLPHRFELIANYGDCLLINDSKATNVDATCLSLANIKTRCTLLLGGQGKGEDYTPILKYSDRIIRVVAFGQERNRIAKQLSTHVPVICRDTLKNVLEEFSDVWMEGVVLLSPACASFDEFRNFEERGELFRKWASSIALG
jgi:UDP-N-acetylmuramoylalanine--D-glutamate ligase